MARNSLASTAHNIRSCPAKVEHKLPVGPFSLPAVVVQSAAKNSHREREACTKRSQLLQHSQVSLLSYVARNITYTVVAFDILNFELFNFRGAIAYVLCATLNCSSCRFAAGTCTVKVKVRDSGCNHTLFRPFSMVGPLQFSITND